jgi:hypothetical protein
MHAVEVSQPTVCRVRKQYFEEGLDAAINRRPPNPEYHRKLDGEQEARLVALACSEPPEGQARSSAAGLRAYVLLLPPSGGPTQVGTTRGLAFRAVVGANGKPEVEIVL